MTAVVGEEFRDSQLREYRTEAEGCNGGRGNGGGGEYPTFLLSRDQNQLNPSVHISRGSKPFLILDLSSRYTRNTEPVLALLQVATRTGEDG